MRRIEQFHHPRSLEEAVALLAQGAGRAAVLAGGTEIVARCPENVTAFVDISRLGLDVIDADSDGYRLGACATLQQIVDHGRLRNYLEGIIWKTAFESATRFIRNAATVGGNLVSSNPQWDLVAGLLAADAAVVMQSPDGERRIAIDEFLSRREEHVTPGHVVTGVELPRYTQQTRAVFEKLARCAHDAPVVAVVARWTPREGRFEDVRVVVGGMGDRPQRLRLVEADLEGRAASRDEIERATALVADQVHPVADVRASAEYRAEMAAVLVRRALLAAIQ